MSTQQHPLLPPYMVPGCWPGASTDEQKLAQMMLKQEIMTQTALESCVVKSLISGGFGFGLGAFFSLMSSSFRYEDPFSSPAFANKNTAQKASEMFKDMGRGMYSGGKSWGYLGLLFTGLECCIEGYRGKHDTGNVFAGGFLSGCILQRHNGMKSGVLSGLGFGIFGAAVDHYWVEKIPEDAP